MSINNMKNATILTIINKFSLIRIFIFSCLMFFILSIFGVYNYRIYNIGTFFLYFIYEAIFMIGLRSGGSRVFKKNILLYDQLGKLKTNRFKIVKIGRFIIIIIDLMSILSFFYFLYLYMGHFDITSFGYSIKAEFDEMGRTKLETVTMFIMFAGSATYLILSSVKHSVSPLMLNISRICLFLPGLRGAFLGRRFILAVEFLLFFFVEYPNIGPNIGKLKKKRKKIIRYITFIFIIIILLMLYIFSNRLVYLPNTLNIAERGDTFLKPFWNNVYSKIGNKISILAYISFYAGHAPYAFSYSLSNLYPVFPKYWGLQTLKVVIQILTSLFRISPSYSEMAHTIPAIPRYVGFGGTLNIDFGIYLAPLMAFLFGMLFARIEANINKKAFCNALYPILQVSCLFAPVYYFTVGVLDHVAFWTIIMSLLCLTKIFKVDEK